MDSLGSQLRSLAAVFARTFLWTWLAMTAGGIVLAVLSEPWMPRVDPVVRALLQIFFALEFLVVGFVVALRSALSLALIAGVRQMQVGRLALRLFMDQVARGDSEISDDDSNVIDSPSSPSPASEEISTIVAAERLQRLVGALSPHLSSRRRGVFDWLRAALFRAVGTITLSRFRSKSQYAEKIDLASVERELEGQIDDLVLGRLRITLFVWPAVVVAILVAEVVGVSLLANELAR